MSIDRIREALNGGDFGPMLAPAVEKVLAHVEAQAAEIEELRERCHEYAMALADKEQR